VHRSTRQRQLTSFRRCDMPPSTLHQFRQVLRNQKPRDCISRHAALTGVGKFSGGAGYAVVIMGSYCRALRRLGRFLKTAARLVPRIICYGPAASLLGKAAYPPITSSGSDGTSRIACLASVCAVRAVITGRYAFACHNRCC